MPTDELLLTHPDSPTPRHLHLAVDGARLLRRSWRGTAKERHTGRDLPNPQAARDALAREVVARMREGFVFVRDSAGTHLVSPSCAAPRRTAMARRPSTCIRTATPSPLPRCTLAPTVPTYT